MVGKIGVGRKPDPIKYCQWCNTLLVRRTDEKGRMKEDPCTFIKRKFCSYECGARRDETSLEQKGKASRQYRKSCCEVCKSKEKLITHHCDENKENNDPENIQTLCRSCHATHHHEARRLGKYPAGRMNDKFI